MIFFKRVLKELLNSIDRNVLWMILNSENLNGELAIDIAVKYGRINNVNTFLETIFQKTICSCKLLNKI